MPGTNQNDTENQEPTKEEKETEETKEEAEQYEDRVTDAITGVIDSEEEDD